MSNRDTQQELVDRIALSVITAREPVANNRWIDERWRVVGVVAVQADAPRNIQRTLLRYGPDGEQYLWTGFTLYLRPNEADSYYYNIIGQNPSLYIYCHNDDNGEPCPRSITAEYIDAMAHSETGNATFSVPMPPEVYRAIEQYVLAHFVPEKPKMKRKHEHEAKRAGIREDE
ncbi:MAG: hypothetical protein A2W18_03410 [Candidatus Muproteobacteria bacterium RBG_16_60_9]|uniref:DUF3305 domain-containing protein n=1 Tax=Candidatus Muproteobacteria bacterium RBG_16_60_9 TaxID=1817755 RepID=A0A1F6UVS5_9PROT|nr:MAG: hypothetical protein A2W18_03410 [Candidatus Muproteobacteria bacterium RBG_16_60_9]